MFQTWYVATSEHLIVTQGHVFAIWTCRGERFSTFCTDDCSTLYLSLLSTNCNPFLWSRRIGNWLQRVSLSRWAYMLWYTIVSISNCLPSILFWTPFRIQIYACRLSNTNTERSVHTHIFATCFITVLIVCALMHGVPFTFLCIVIITVPFAFFEVYQ